MKFIVIALAGVLFVLSVSAAVVDNSVVSPTGEDSLAVAFCALDSLGNPGTADSVFVSVAGPSGGLVYVDSMAISDPRITAAAAGGGSGYVFRSQVSSIDGDGIAGVYALLIAARNGTFDLVTPTTASFQVVGEELSDRLAQLNDTVWVRGGAVDSNRTERGLSAGSGSRAVVLVAVDEGTGQVIPNVRVTVRNLDQTAVLGLGLTDVSGAAVFALDADSCLAVATAAGYVFDPADTADFAVSSADTLFGTAWYPEPPAGAGMCRVWGILYGIDGSPQAGATVTASLAGGVARYGGSVISPAPVSTTTDSTGLFQFDLIPSATMEADDTRYDLSIMRADGIILRQRVTVPAVDVWQLSW